jgi:hypothetical protein
MVSEIPLNSFGKQGLGANGREPRNDNSNDGKEQYLSCTLLTQSLASMLMMFAAAYVNILHSTTQAEKRRPNADGVFEE